MQFHKTQTKQSGFDTKLQITSEVIRVVCLFNSLVLDFIYYQQNKIKKILSQSISLGPEQMCRNW